MARKTAKKKREAGRPSVFSAELGTQICQHLVDGLSLRQIAELSGMPSKSTILSWLVSRDKKFTEFLDQYARAREAQAWDMAEYILDIADDGRNDWMERELKSGEVIEVVNHEAINRSKLRVESRKWLMSKLLPKKFGEPGKDADDTQRPNREIVWRRWSERGK